MLRVFATILIASMVFTSCSSGPSADEIKKKILLNYVCRQTAKVNNLEVLEQKETKTMFGGKAMELLVSGEVEWPDGCKALGARVGPGYKEKFQRKVFLSKLENGRWE
jgi:hypothetical protein